jgi:hypothetical protein
MEVYKMENKLNTISDLRKVMNKQVYENVYGTPSIEYNFEDVPAWIEKLGSKMAHDKNRPYRVRYKGLGKNFKTLNECLQYILYGSYIHDSEMLENSIKNHFSYNPN